ncbi:MAG: DUF3566 domain-containing protein [Candidatus Zixiibacteriota bacterium]
MRYELKKISLWAFIKVFFFVNMILGFLIGLLYALFFGFIFAIMQNLPYMPDQGIEPPPDVPIGILMVFLPFLFAILGGFIYTVLGAIFVLIFNLVVKLTGGIEFNLESLVDIVPAPQPSYAQTQMPQYSTPPPPPPPVEENLPESSDQPRRPPDDEFPSRTVGG